MNDPYISSSFIPAINNYGRRCAQEIAFLPPINCLEGEIIPVTVNGKEPKSYPKNLKCDRPSMQDLKGKADSQCVPYSRVLKLPLQDPDTIAVAFCRRYKEREKDSPLFDDISIILHRKSSGATCFFQSTDDRTKALDGTRVPPPHELPIETPLGEEVAAKFWLPPEKVALRRCHQCHDSDPFIHSPYISQTSQIPSHPKGAYKIVGKEFSDWPIVYGVDTKDKNLCTSCHRMGHQYSCNEYAPYSTGDKPILGQHKGFKSFPKAHWMPPNPEETSLKQWQERYLRDILQIQSCCKNPDQDFCRVTPITSNIGF